MVANRVVWSLVLLVILTLVTRTWAARSPRPGRDATSDAGGRRGLPRPQLGRLRLGRATDQVVEASLGYFINPLVSVGLGVIVLRERLRTGQWVAVGIAVLAVAVLTVSYGRLPWISLILAFSFGIYGLIKKQVGVGAVESLTIETAALAPLALIVMVALRAFRHSALTTGDPQTTCCSWCSSAR